MKHIILTAIFSLSLFSISFFSNGQACTPNNDTIPGITPDTLDVAFVGIPYQQVIYFRLPHDTSVVFGPDTIPIVIDSLLITGVEGLPAAFSYACNAPNCIVYGGGNGCAVISGIADTADLGIHPLNVFVSTFISDTAGAYAGFVPDTVTGYFLDVELATGIPAFVTGNASSLGKIFPNPSAGEVTIPFYLPEGGNVTILVLDLQGRVCLEKSISGKRGYNTEVLNVALLLDGAYFIKVESDGNNLFSRIQVLKN